VCVGSTASCAPASSCHRRRQHGLWRLTAERHHGTGLSLPINDPGNAELAITVGSTHRDMPHTYGVSYFSSKGPTGDGRLKPDLVAPGERILSCATGRAVDDKRRWTASSQGPPPVVALHRPQRHEHGGSHVSGAIASFLIRREFIGRPARQAGISRERHLPGPGAVLRGQRLVDLMRAIQAV
jgi:hypothetical protein